jgi:hypothetical protein
MSTNLNNTNIIREGRECDPTEIIRQIGKWNLLAISGGLWGAIKDSEGYEVGVFMPCSRNRMVEVILDFSDTYTVKRTRRVLVGANAGTTITEYETSFIYCDQVGEVAYQASCWK